ncbi:alpha/beta hydrolase [Aliiglaciecola sp. LCG003]|uniref:alpha/beta hydrolase n=1 Tax=Aliiglaciecola sp. LCG003 TaxID=3053655 RepID=UPI002572CFDE|nr:alpha/beta hydrolase [Aliiglaciecola sp. LCG003]WJG10346.1 alpha/beta hydrolase [Aliiglaciecola sp. LCG003]
MYKFSFLVAMVFLAAMSNLVSATEKNLPWQDNVKGKYIFSKWDGGKVSVNFTVPPTANADTPILLVVPGAKRNADNYRDQWHQLALKHNFIVLAIGCSLKTCQSEYEYNMGGIFDHTGRKQGENRQFFSVPELVFNDFVEAFHSQQKTFALYGHSAGGGFVHLYMLTRPNAPVSRAVSANAAFFTFPDEQITFPFGLKSSTFNSKNVEDWLQTPLIFMLADQDIGPRTKPLSNSQRAREQGLSVFSRGLSFYSAAINTAAQKNIKPTWKLEIVQDVGHNSTKIVPHAFKYLFPQLIKEL